MLRLPMELYLSIFEHLDKRSDIHNLLFLSRDFLQDAERRLYQTVSLKEVDLNSSLSLFRRLAAPDQSRIAKYVRDLDIWSTVLDPPNYPLIHQALKSTTNLRRLSVEGLLWGPSDGEDVFLISGCTFELISLHTSAFDVTYSSVLERQTSLEELSIGHVNGYQPWDMADVVHSVMLPNLKLLSCTANDVAYFLGDPRSLKCIHFTAGIPDSLGDRSITELVSMSLELVSFEPDILQSILAPFPSLRYFRCSISDYEPPGVSICLFCSKGPPDLP